MVIITLTPAFLLDSVLPLASSMSIASALHWILEHNYGATLLHYLDDFLLLLHVCQKLGMPVAREKSEGPATSLIFLGIVMDSSLQQLWLPPAKLQEIAAIIKCWLEKSQLPRGISSPSSQALLCLQGGPSRSPLPVAPDPPIHHS